MKRQRSKTDLSRIADKMSFYTKLFKSNLRYATNRVTVDRRSKIYELLKDNWTNYKKDEYPIDRRMRVLKKKNIVGMSSENIRYFINETVKRFAKNGTYLEIGAFQGCSILSAALFNPSTRCIGIDNFSEFNKNNENETKLKENLAKFSGMTNIEYYKKSCAKGIQYLFSKEPGLTIDVYYYDGMHTREEQMKGLKAMQPYLAKKCIIFVDDINWDFVEKANRNFIRENREFKSVLKIRTKELKYTGWWNGFEVISRGI